MSKIWYDLKVTKETTVAELIAQLQNMPSKGIVPILNLLDHEWQNDPNYQPSPEIRIPLCGPLGELAATPAPQSSVPTAISELWDAYVKLECSCDGPEYICYFHQNIEEEIAKVGKCGYSGWVANLVAASKLAYNQGTIDEFQRKQMAAAPQSDLHPIERGESFRGKHGPLNRPTATESSVPTGRHDGSGDPDTSNAKLWVPAATESTPAPAHEGPCYVEPYDFASPLEIVKPSTPAVADALREALQKIADLPILTDAYFEDRVSAEAKHIAQRALASTPPAVTNALVDKLKMLILRIPPSHRPEGLCEAVNELAAASTPAQGEGK